ncbi:MAG: hypothetical protein RL700_630 [Pseudomonadota bacterium]
MENLALVRPFAGHGGPGYFSVRFGSNDPSHFAQHEQVQLAGWREKACRSIGAKLAHARSSACRKVLNFVSTGRCCLKHSTCVFYSFFVMSLAAGGLTHGHAQL